jgi:hypothetical protein
MVYFENAFLWSFFHYTTVSSYIGNDKGADWFSKNMMLANRVNGE